MIKNNTVDLTGFAYNINCKDFDTYISVFFTLSMNNRYKDKEGNNVSNYNTVSCVLTSNKDINGGHSKSFEYFNKNVFEGKLLRLQGMISSWIEGLINGEIVTVTDENKSNVKRYIPRNIIRVSDYLFLEKKTKTSEQVPSDSAYKDKSLDMIGVPTDFSTLELPIYKSIVNHE